METHNNENVSSVLGLADSDPTKERLFTHALERFRNEGFARITVEELTTDLSMSKKTFYKYFPGKEDLVRYAADRMIRNLVLQVRAIVDADEEFVVKLNRLMIFLAGQVRRLGKPFMRDVQRHLPDLWHSIEETRRKNIGANLARLFEQGQATGQVRNDIPVRLFLLAFLGAAERVIDPAVIAEEQFSMEDALTGLMTMFFQGILSPEARSRFEHLHQPSPQR